MGEKQMPGIQETAALGSWEESKKRLPGGLALKSAEPGSSASDLIRMGCSSGGAPVTFCCILPYLWKQLGNRMQLRPWWIGMGLSFFWTLDEHLTIFQLGWNQTSCLIAVLLPLLYMTPSHYQCFLRILVGADTTESLTTSDVTSPIQLHAQDYRVSKGVGWCWY